MRDHRDLERHGWAQRWQLAIFCAGIWLHAAHSLLVATTMPAAITEIGGADLVAWVFTLYQIGSILAGAVTGRCVLRYGIRPVLVLAACLYAIGCVLCAMAPNMRLLLGGRLLQGCGGGTMVALAYVALERLFPSRLMPRLIAVFSVIWSGAAFCGPLIGGLFAAAGLWRFAFWSFAAQAVLLALAATLSIKPSEPRPADKSAAPVPIGRLFLLASVIVAIGLIGAKPATFSAALLAFAAGLLLWWFLRLDARSAGSRLLPSHSFNPRGTLGAGMIAVAATSIATMSFLVYGPFLLTILHGIDALTAGYLIAAESLAWAAAAVLIAKAKPAAEPWLIRTGSLMILAGLAGFALTVPMGSLWGVLLCAILQGAGYGTMWSFIVRRVIEAAPDHERPLAAAVLPTIQQVGFAIGASACGIVANLTGFQDGIAPTAIAHAAFWLFAAFLPIGLIAAMAAWRAAR